jgi:hypothetical protein
MCLGSQAAVMARDDDEVFRLGHTSSGELVSFTGAATTKRTSNENHRHNNSYDVHELQRAIAAVWRDTEYAFDKVHAPLP